MKHDERISPNPVAVVKVTTNSNVTAGTWQLDMTVSIEVLVLYCAFTSENDHAKIVIHCELNTRHTPHGSSAIQVVHCLQGPNSDDGACVDAHYSMPFTEVHVLYCPVSKPTEGQWGCTLCTPLPCLPSLSGINVKRGVKKHFLI